MMEADPLLSSSSGAGTCRLVWRETAGDGGGWRVIAGFRPTVRRISPGKVGLGPPSQAKTGTASRDVDPVAGPGVVSEGAAIVCLQVIKTGVTQDRRNPWSTASFWTVIFEARTGDDEAARINNRIAV